MAGKAFVVIAVLALCASVHADMVFHASFDKGLDADTAAGDGKANAPKSAKRVPGKMGDGVELGSADAYLAYPTEGNVSLAKGSIAMWVKPVGFSPSQLADVEWDQFDLFRIVVRTRPHSDEMRLRILRINRQTGQESMLEMLTGPAGEDGFGGSGKRVYVRCWLRHKRQGVMNPWKEGEFKHVAATWDHERGRVEIYLDGKRAGVMEKDVLKKKSEKPEKSFAVGPFRGTMYKGGKGSDVKKVVIDDVRIYDHCLTAEQAAALAAPVPDEE
jgi:hypothetical protein